MPEEVIRSQDIDPAGTPGAAFLGTMKLQRLEKAQDEILEAAGAIANQRNKAVALLGVYAAALRDVLMNPPREDGLSEEDAKAAAVELLQKHAADRGVELDFSCSMRSQSETA